MNKKFILFFLFLTLGIVKNSIAMGDENNLKKRKIDAILKEDKDLPNKKQKTDILAAKKTLLKNPMALHHACDNNKLDKAELLISAGAKINEQISSKQGSEEHIDFYAGYSPLHFAATKGNTKLIKLLISNGATTNVTNNRGHTPFDLAIKTNDIKITKLLIKHETNLNKKNNYGLTPLALAFMHNAIDNAYLLIASGADYNTQDNQGNTILHQIILNGSYDPNKNHQKEFFTLLTHLCNKTIQNNNGMTAQELLSEKLEDTHSLFNKESEKILMEALNKLKKHISIDKYRKNLTKALHTYQINGKTNKKLIFSKQTSSEINNLKEHYKGPIKYK